MTLVDSGFLIDLMRTEPAAVAKELALEQAGERVLVSAVVVYELERGLAAARAPEAERARIGRVLYARTVVPLDEAAARRAGEVDGTLRARGQPIDPEDALIAGTALVRGETLVTRNIRHFARIPGLRLETY